MSGIRVSLAFALLIIPSPSAAQRQFIVGDTLQLAVGTWKNTVKGVLMETTPDTLVLHRAGGGEHRVAASRVVAARVLEGRKPGTGAGAQVGFGVGLLIGGVLGTAAAAESNGYFDFGPVVAIGATLGGGLGGALLGALIGSTGRQDRWVPVSIPRAPSEDQGERPVTRHEPIIRAGVESTVLLGLRLRR